MRTYGKSNRSPGTAKTDEKIRNIGPKSAAWLRQVGVHSNDDVKAQTAFEVYLRVRRAGFRATLNLLYALAGAEDDCHWQELSEERKSGLLQALADAEATDPRLNKKRSFTTGVNAASAVVTKALGLNEPIDHEATTPSNPGDD